MLKKVPVKNIEATDERTVNDAFYAAWAESWTGMRTALIDIQRSGKGKANEHTKRASRPVCVE
eukprot:scaffold84795_cov56-Attheya_sp.AAC.3